MKPMHVHGLVAVALLLPAAVAVQGCRESNTVETIPVTLRNTDTYQYPTVGGDDDGARISTQAGHYSISEIRRNAETNWVAVYVYRPAPAFVGEDYAELEIFTGSDGASPPTDIRRVAFRFLIPD